MGKYSNENWEAIKARLGVLEVAKGTIAEVVALSNEIMDYVASMSNQDKTTLNGIPFFTGNLIDSIGIGIYYKGSLISMVTNPAQADGSQSWTEGGGEVYRGRDKLQDAFNMSLGLSNELTIRIFSASPISEMINEDGSPNLRGIGFFDNIIKFAQQAAERRFL